jgi:hypothetical protein
MRRPPSAVHLTSLSASPGISEGLSVQSCSTMTPPGGGNGVEVEDSICDAPGYGRSGLRLPSRFSYTRYARAEISSRRRSGGFAPSLRSAVIERTWPFICRHVLSSVGFLSRARRIGPRSDLIRTAHLDSPMCSQALHQRRIRSCLPI